MIVLGTGSLITHKTKNNGILSRTLFRMLAEKRAFCQGTFLVKGDVVHCTLGNGADLCVNEGQLLSERRVSLAEEEERRKIFDRVWSSRKTAVLDRYVFPKVVFHM